METRISKWGNSLALRIPSVLVREANLSVGLEMEIKSKGEEIVLTPKKRFQYKLDDLLKEVNEKNLQEEVDAGESIGKEEW
ncbi:MAG: AbrB/MazE/SpoVT family DNA-binding domain-containing protein [Verrucomicrobiales bacterium]|nr:AbrB/MazE/SpoVT family DNA-binding domain-containing protein [Verrucomicrobiales bacterium]